MVNSPIHKLMMRSVESGAQDLYMILISVITESDYKLDRIFVSVDDNLMATFSQVVDIHPTQDGLVNNIIVTTDTSTQMRAMVSASNVHVLLTSTDYPPITEIIPKDIKLCIPNLVPMHI